MLFGKFFKLAHHSGSTTVDMGHHLPSLFRIDKADWFALMGLNLWHQSASQFKIRQSVVAFRG